MASFYRDTWMEISLDNVVENIQNLKKYYYHDKRILAVVKANSYGHGAVEIAQVLEEQGIDFFGVATIDEALELRHSGIKSALFVFGLIRLSDLRIVSQFDLTISITSLVWLKKACIKYTGPQINVHLKVETGLNRLGLREHEIDEAITLLNNSPYFNLEGIYSHLATAPLLDETYYQFQLANFMEIVDKIKAQYHQPIPYIHITNSAASIKPLPKEINLIRLGLMLNGVLPSKQISLPFTIKPSLSLYSHLVDVKLLPKGSKLGYNCEYETSQDEWIGTIAIGYADGLLPSMTGGWVYLEGEYHQLVGRICMDYCFVRLNQVYEIGTLVEFIGPNQSVDKFAEYNHTHNYHATCMLSDRIPRLYYYHHKLVKTVNRRLHYYNKEEK